MLTCVHYCEVNTFVAVLSAWLFSKGAVTFTFRSPMSDELTWMESRLYGHQIKK